ncbi:MAG: hypothetical protein E6Q88_11280 [Lysobacteraceae bacterium]|nr:MAG: hypothetical protein E6Q88_11280 [Xanthomonadaceae bacterium]
MSSAYDSFRINIQDAIELLKQFDAINNNPPPPEAEVLKRAGLMMALTALETYIEDRITEAADEIVMGSEDSILGKFYADSLKNDLKYFHTPNTDRVRVIFRKYLAVDVTEGWAWNNYDQTRARKELDELVKVRGEIAHRSLRPKEGEPAPHVVTKDSLRKAIRFIRDLVEATDSFLAQSSA